MTDWTQDLPGHLDRAWHRLAEGAADPDAPGRIATLATTGPDDRPEARLVVLRGADRAAGTLEVHSDARTGKVRALSARPMAALVVWIPPDRLQIRIEAVVTIRTGAEARTVWDRLPDGGRLAYGIDPPPGTPVDDALYPARRPDPEALAVLTFGVERIETLHLGSPHRRAVFGRGAGWSGRWLSP